jgi:hypothetical protein
LLHGIGLNSLFIFHSSGSVFFAMIFAIIVTHHSFFLKWE